MPARQLSSWSPNVDQRKVINTLTGLNLVIAGPGTGKTETLAAKAAKVLERDGRPLVVTYTRSAAAELVQRLGSLRARATVKTCHGFAFRLFTQLAPLCDNPRRLLHSAQEREAILQHVLRRLTGTGVLQEGRSLRELGEQVSRLKILGPRTAAEHRLLTLYEEVKGPHRMDFQDLLLLTTEMLVAHPERLHGYQQVYTHVLIDEAQDLDPLQARFLVQFVPPHDALTIFLDPDQAIYGFAGADPRQTLPIFEHIAPQTMVELRPNYRSRAPIVQSALALIQHNPSGHGGHTRTMIPTRPGTVPPRWVRVRTQAAEARLIADTISALLRHGVLPADILCLFRTNPYRTMLEVELTRRQIPFSLVQASQEWHPTYLEWGVLPLTALLLAADGDGTLPAGMERTVLRPYVGAKVSGALVMRDKTPLGIASRALDEVAARGIDAYLADLQELRALRFLPVAVLGDIALRMLQRRPQHVLQHDGITTSAVEALTLFSSLSAFTAHVHQLLALRHTPTAERVRLSTIHRSKGTQSRTVFLLGASDGVFPPTQPGTDLEEERRICFVAMTRAKDGLIVSSPRVVGGRSTRPSRFIREGRCQRLFFPLANRIAAQLMRLS